MVSPSLIVITKDNQVDAHLVLMSYVESRTITKMKKKYNKTCHVRKACKKYFVYRL